MKFLIVISMPGELAKSELPDIVYILSINQKVSVSQPITPAIIAPNLAPFLTKKIENTMPKYHKLLSTSQFVPNISGLHTLQCNLLFY